MIDVSKKSERPRTQKHFVSYAEVAQVFIDEVATDVMPEVKHVFSNGVKKFAEYLEQRNTIGGDSLTVMAMTKAREIEKEILNALIDHIGVAKAQEVMMPIIKKHRHVR